MIEFIQFLRLLRPPIGVRPSDWIALHVQDLFIRLRSCVLQFLPYTGVYIAYCASAL